MATYDIGDLVRVSVTLAVGGVNTDPTTLKVKIKTPADVITTYTYGDAQVVKDAVGQYHIDVSITQAGTYYYRWESTGTAQGAEESYFIVNASEF